MPLTASSLHKLLQLSVLARGGTYKQHLHKNFLLYGKRHLATSTCLFSSTKSLTKTMDVTPLSSESDIRQATLEKGDTCPKAAGEQMNGSDGNSKTMSKRAQKRLARCQKYKELQKQKKAENQKLAQKDDAGYSSEDFNQSAYYFENGLRKVYPYSFTFCTHAKGRWVGRTIENVLLKEFGFDHPDDLLKAFDAGHICVNNNQVGPNYKIRECDYISHRIHRHENPVCWAPLEVVKDTEDLIVINKPSSIPCHPCGRYRFNSVVFILGKEMGYTNLRNIYRLDRLTSGVLILAKTMEMTKTLEDQVVNRQVQKEYVCRVVGKFPEGIVKVDQPLRPLSNKLRLQVVCPTGKASQTEFELLSYNGKSSVVKCRPFTGRTHQIRVHLQYLGHPIINDAFYNNPAWGPSKGKGGSYEVPFDQVCERILREHHANLWDGGENPLYFEKVREMEESQGTVPREKVSQDRTSALEPVTEALAGCTPSAETLSTRDRLRAIASSGGEASETQVSDCEPACKVRKLDLHGEAESFPLHQENSFTSVASKTSGLPISSSSACESNGGNDHSLDVCDKGSSTLIDSISASGGTEYRQDIAQPASSTVQQVLAQSQSHPVVSTVPVKGDLKGDKATGGSEYQSAGICGDQKASKLCPDGRPGFEVSKWSVDLKCELCKRVPIEPREKDLVMFLHALKYKGIGWEYETALPDWASAEWAREEDYVDSENTDAR